MTVARMAQIVSDEKVRRGDIVRWRCGSYRVVATRGCEIRIESLENPGAFNWTSPAQVQKVRAR